MNNEHPTQEKNNGIIHYKDEIELIDILKVVWKWKYIILTGAALCVLIATILSLNTTKIYSIDMVLGPSVSEVGEQEENVYIESLKKIKILIESGAFTSDILSYLKENNLDNIQSKLDFKITTPDKTDTIRVKYETADIKKGMIILNRLSKLLIKEYSNLAQYSKSEYNIQSNLIKHQIDLIKYSIESYKRNITNIDKRIGELISEIKLIKNNTVNLAIEKNKLISKNPKENDDLQALFYTYIIHENQKISNNYLNEINDYKLKKEEQLRNIYTLNNQKEMKLHEINKIHLKKDTIQSLQILQPPTKNPLPIKPKTKQNIIFALVAGLFLMTFLAFFLEYLVKSIKK